METTLHRQLKEHFAGPSARLEVRVDGYRIDVVEGGRLTEIQFSGLAAIRDKVRALLAAGHVVDVVKPIVARKLLVGLKRKGGPVVTRRWSPRRGNQLDVFGELLHFATVFPHPRLRLLTPLVDVEEIRFPGHGKRRRWRASDFVVADCRLLAALECHVYCSAADLSGLLPALPAVFDTAELATGLGVPRWRAQQIAWVLKKTGAAEPVSRDRRGLRYRLVQAASEAAIAETDRAATPPAKRAGRKSRAA